MRVLSLPVLTKEMRSRMRGMRAQWLLFSTTALAVLLTLVIIYWQTTEMQTSGVAPMEQSAEIGHILFIGLVIFQGAIAVLLAPALTAGTISSERDQHTLEMLFLTRLSCLNIVLGKLFSALGFLAVILLCSLPVLAISFMLGGVDPGQLGWSLALILATMLLFGAIGVYCSARYARTATAIVLAYLGALAWIAAFPFLFICYMSLNSDNKLQVPIVIGAAMLVSAVFVWVLHFLLASIRRRPLAVLTCIIVWLVLAAAGAWLVVNFQKPVHDFMNSDYGPWSMAGNPFFAAGFLLTSGDHSGLPQAVERFFTPITLVVILLGAWFFIAQAVRELRKLRDPDQPRRMIRQTVFSATPICRKKSAADRQHAVDPHG